MTSPSDPSVDAPAVLRLLHQDDWLVAVDKPSGLLVHRGWGNDAVVMVDVLERQLGRRVFPVHRLDRATSGVLLVALSSAAARALQAQFEDGRVAKGYLALVRGVPADEGLIDHPVPRREDGPRVPAQTGFRRLRSIGHCSLVAAFPHTGRLHQIRRHLKHLSHPLLGDANYGKGALNRQYRADFGLERLALHAQSIRFEHPGSGGAISLVAAVPEDLAAPLRRIGFVEEDWLAGLPEHQRPDLAGAGAQPPWG